MVRSQSEVWLKFSFTGLSGRSPKISVGKLNADQCIDWDWCNVFGCDCQSLISDNNDDDANQNYDDDDDKDDDDDDDKDKDKNDDDDDGRSRCQSDHTSGTRRPVPAF